MLIINSKVVAKKDVAQIVSAITEFVMSMRPWTENQLSLIGVLTDHFIGIQVAVKVLFVVETTGYHHMTFNIIQVLHPVSPFVKVVVSGVFTYVFPKKVGGIKNVIEIGECHSVQKEIIIRDLNAGFLVYPKNRVACWPPVILSGMLMLRPEKVKDRNIIHGKKAITVKILKVKICYRSHGNDCL